MEKREQYRITVVVILAVSLCCISVTAALLTGYYSRLHYQALMNLCGEIVQEQPGAKEAVLQALKSCQRQPAAPKADNILSEYGYKPSDFRGSVGIDNTIFAAISAVFLCGAALFFVSGCLWRRKLRGRIASLTGYLEQVNTGGGSVLPPESEDLFSGLQDEIYKTVTELYQTREAAVRARDGFAENLYNIAHQIRTPITAISLSLQMLRQDMAEGAGKRTSRAEAEAKENPFVRAEAEAKEKSLGRAEAEEAKEKLSGSGIPRDYPAQIGRQLSRLTRLEESLLLLSRIDAGTLAMERKEVDVYTLLVLAADHLQELSAEAQVAIDIPEAGEAMIRADMEWMMEAVINLLKNCLEHTPPQGSVFCSYERNPLYVLIRIRDTGEGFAREDLPRLFERFYRGKTAGKDGIGIGLSLARAIVERQNGTLTAKNETGGGACFEIRMYSH